MAESYGSEYSSSSQSGVVTKQESDANLYTSVPGIGERSPSDSDSPSDTPPFRRESDVSRPSRPSSLRSEWSSRSTNESDIEGTGAGDNIRVVVRVRPLNPSEKEKGSKNIIKLPGNGALWIDNSFGQIKPFTFNSVLGEATSQAEMFEDCGIKLLINMALEGYSCTAFAFGQTGSGKTYTITGPLDSQFQDGALPTPQMQGLIERSFQYMFNEMEKKSEQVNYTLRASYLEVYNERVKDLLNPSSAHDSLPVRWSRDRGFYVENLFYVECDTLDDLLAVLEEGLKYRQVGSHNVNDHSSRSHSMLTVYMDIESCDPDDGGGFSILRHGKISFVDLAGSERVKETKSVGETFTESQNINKSLLTLGNCISALSDAKKRGGHIPYRESKLTKLLADSLGGDGVTLMIACISPSSHVVSDTLNTLRYAHRAKKIKNKPVVQMDPKEKLILSLKREIKLLRTENNYFRQQLGLPSSESQTTITEISYKDNKDQNDNSVTHRTTPPQPQQPGKSNSLFVREDERNKLTTASLTAGANSGLYDMLQEYMIENEHLRSENSDLHKSREEISRQQTVVSRENERLLKKLEDLERVFVASPLSLRSLSGVERSRSLAEGNRKSDSPGYVHLQLTHDEHKSISNPVPRYRSTSEPPLHRELLRFPPIANGPYPNYVNETWPREDSQQLDAVTQHPNRQPLSKSSPAKLRKKPPVEKQMGGYASIFTKQKEKEKRAKKMHAMDSPPRMNVHMHQSDTQTTAHAQSYQYQSSVTTHAPSYSYQSLRVPVPGYAGQVRQGGVPGINTEAYYTHGAPQGSTSHMNEQLTADLGNLDSQIDYQYAKNTPNR